MTTDTPPATALRSQLDWLRGELSAWQDAGLVAPDQAEAILGRYSVVADATVDERRRFSLARLLLTVGAAFVGVGLVWLVAANLDQLPPTVRFLAVAALWLTFLVGTEVLHERRPSATLRVGAGRLLAAVASGALIFQAAQSMQVPAYEPALVGLWGAAALAHAYAVGGVAPLVVGLGAGTVWWVWQPLAASFDLVTAVLALASGAVLAASVASLHDARRPDGGPGERAGGRTGGRAGHLPAGLFAAPWRYLAALLALAALFVAALPYVDGRGFSWTPWLVCSVVVAGLAVAAALLRGRGLERLEPVGALAVLGTSVLLAFWAGADDADGVGAEDWAHAALSVGAYAALAVGLAVVGTVRGSWPLTGLATAALVVFTTSQSFAVFAQIIQGAWLFVALGLVLLGTGFLFDRARRGLAATLEGVDR